MEMDNQSILLCIRGMVELLPEIVKSQKKFSALITYASDPQVKTNARPTSINHADSSQPDYCHL